MSHVIQLCIIECVQIVRRTHDADLTPDPTIEERRRQDISRSYSALFLILLGYVDI